MKNILLIFFQIKKIVLYLQNNYIQIETNFSYYFINLFKRQINFIGFLLLSRQQWCYQ